MSKSKNFKYKVIDMEKVFNCKDVNKKINTLFIFLSKLDLTITDNINFNKDNDDYSYIEEFLKDIND